MHSRFAKVVALVACTCVGIVFYLYRTDAPVVAESAPTPYYVYDYYEADGTYQDGGGMGTGDRLGVAKSVLDEVGDCPDFAAIAAEATTREQFLIQEGRTVDPNSVWDVRLGEVETENGQQRFAVFAALGKDVVDEARNAEFVQTDAMVYEIWQTSNGSGSPILLDRSLMSFHGVQTHSEVPNEKIDVPVTGDLFGGDDDVGFVGPPPGMFGN